MRENRVIIFCLVALSVFFACAGKGYLGKTAPENDRIPLTSGKTTAGNLEEFAYTMAYQYDFRPGNSGLPGRIELNGEVSATRLERLDIYVNFLDGQGQILAREDFFSYDRRLDVGAGLRNVRRSPFKVSLETPPGTSAMSFTDFSQEYIPRRRGRD